MSAGAISAAGGSAVNANNAFSQLSSADFVKVLITELTHQDPFQPQDSGALLEQLSSLRNIESQMTLQEKLGQLVDNNSANQEALLSGLDSLIIQNQLTTAGSLIGKQVQGVVVDDNYEVKQVSGIVTSVRMDSGRIYLELDTGKTLPMSQVTMMTNADQTEAMLTSSQAPVVTEDQVYAA